MFNRKLREAEQSRDDWYRGYVNCLRDLSQSKRDIRELKLELRQELATTQMRLASAEWLADVRRRSVEQLVDEEQQRIEKAQRDFTRRCPICNAKVTDRDTTLTGESENGGYSEKTVVVRYACGSRHEFVRWTSEDGGGNRTTFTPGPCLDLSKAMRSVQKADEAKAYDKVEPRG